MANCGLRSCLVFLACIAIPGPAAAQSMEPAKLWEVGDKASYVWTESYQFSTNVKSEKNEWEVVQVTDAQVWMDERRGLRRVNRIYDLKQGGLSKFLCISVAEECIATPPVPYADFPLQLGKRTPLVNLTQAETFVAERRGECVVEAFEKVKVPAGEFEAFRTTCAEKATGKTKKGSQFSVTVKQVNWVALVNGKPVIVKIEYSSSVPKRITQELVSFSFK